MTDGTGRDLLAIAKFLVITNLFLPNLIPAKQAKQAERRVMKNKESTSRCLIVDGRFYLPPQKKCHDAISILINTHTHTHTLTCYPQHTLSHTHVRLLKSCHTQPNIQ